MNLNERIAIFATRIFGTMWCFWLFLIWSFLPYVPLLVNAKDAILYISAGVIQLIALPLLMVGQNLNGRAAELRAQEDHNMIIQEFQAIKDLHAESAEMMNDVKELLGDVKNLVSEDYQLNIHNESFRSQLERQETVLHQLLEKNEQKWL